MAKRGKSLISVFFVLLLVAAAVGYYFYKQIYGANVNIDGELSEITIPSGTELDNLAEILLTNNQIKDKSSFLFTAQRMKFFNIKPGKFELQSGWSNVDLIRHLRSGNQKPVKFTFNNIRFIEELGDLLDEKFEMKGDDFVNLIQDESFLSSKGYEKATIMSMFIPNTYEMYWNISAEEFIERMEKEHK
ncbi:MAG: endolytic transglycosylase MltG, partial [Bacteroidota bacterium]